MVIFNGEDFDVQEVDLIEMKVGKLQAFEFKYSPQRKVSIPAALAMTYPEASFVRISRDNYLDWVT